MIKDYPVKVIENISVIDNFYLISLEFNEKFDAMPGQFVEIQINNSNLTDPFLRRPFSIFDFHNNILKIFYKVVGKSTYLLSKLKKGETINLLAPLGNKFSIIENSLLIAGGTGIGGIYFLTRFLNKYKILYGVKNEKEKKYLRDFLNNEHLIIISEERDGTVIDYLLKNDFKYNFIYSCGPEIMMKRLYNEYMKKNKIEGEFSLESYMGCGFGVCLGCVRKIKVNNKIENLRVCKEGPVFNAENIIWE